MASQPVTEKQQSRTASEQYARAASFVNYHSQDRIVKRASSTESADHGNQQHQRPLNVLQGSKPGMISQGSARNNSTDPSNDVMKLAAWVELNTLIRQNMINKVAKKVPAPSKGCRSVMAHSRQDNTQIDKKDIMKLYKRPHTRMDDEVVLHSIDQAVQRNKTWAKAKTYTQALEEVAAIEMTAATSAEPITVSAYVSKTTSPITCSQSKRANQHRLPGWVFIEAQSESKSGQLQQQQTQREREKTPMPPLSSSQQPTSQTKIGPIAGHIGRNTWQDIGSYNSQMLEERSPSQIKEGLQNQQNRLSKQLQRRSQMQSRLKENKLQTQQITMQASCRTQPTLPIAITIQPQVVKQNATATAQQSKVIVQDFLSEELPKRVVKAQTVHNGSNLLSKDNARSIQNNRYTTEDIDGAHIPALGHHVSSKQNTMRQHFPQDNSREVHSALISAEPVYKELQTQEFVDREMVLNFVINSQKRGNLPRKVQRLLGGSRRQQAMLERPYTEMELISRQSSEIQNSNRLVHKRNNSIVEHQTQPMRRRRNIAGLIEAAQRDLVQSQRNEVKIEENDAEIRYEEISKSFTVDQSRKVKGHIMPRSINAASQQMISSVPQPAAIEPTTRQLIRASRSLKVINCPGSQEQEFEKEKLRMGAMSIEETLRADEVDMSASCATKIKIIVSDKNKTDMQKSGTASNQTNSRQPSVNGKKQGSSKNSKASLSRISKKAFVPGSSQTAKPRGQMKLDQKQLQLQSVLQRSSIPTPTELLDDQMNHNKISKRNEQYEQYSREMSVTNSNHHRANSNSKSRSKKRMTKLNTQNTDGVKVVVGQTSHCSLTSFEMIQRPLLVENTIGFTPTNQQHMNRTPLRLNYIPAGQQLKVEQGRKRDPKTAMGTIGQINLKTEVDKRSLHGGFDDVACGDIDTFKTQDYHRNSHQMEIHSERRDSEQIEAAGQDVSSMISSQNNHQEKKGQKIAVNSAHYNTADQELVLENAMQLHRISQQQNMMHENHQFSPQQIVFQQAQLDQQCEVTAAELAEIQQFQRIMIRKQGSMTASNANKRRQSSEMAKMNQTNPIQKDSQWLPETQQFINDLLLQSNQGQKVMVNRRKPFHIKTSMQGGMQGPPRELVVAGRFNKDNLVGSTAIEPNQPSALIQAQPFNVLSTAANKCFHQNTTNKEQLQLQSNTILGIENQDNILIKGVNKGLQPQIGRNLPFDQQKFVTTGALNEDNKAGSKQQVTAEMMRTSTGFHIQQRQQQQQLQQDQQQPAQKKISGKLLQNMNTSQLHRALMQHVNSNYQQAFDPNSYLTVPVQQTQYDAQVLALLQKQQMLEKKTMQAKQFLQSGRKEPQDKLMSQFAKHQAEQERQAERILEEEQIAMQEYHRLLQREIEKLRVMSSGQGVMARKQQLMGQHQQQNIVSPIPMIKNNANTLKQNSMKNHPMSIQSCDQQEQYKVGQNHHTYICPDCHGVPPLADLSKQELQAENFLICHCQDNSESLHRGQKATDASSLMQSNLQTFNAQIMESSGQKKRNKRKRAPQQQPEMFVQQPDSPDLTRLEQLKLMQIQLLNSQPRVKQIQLGLQGRLTNGSNHKQNKAMTLGAAIEDTVNNTINGSASKCKQDGTDLAHLKTVIKKQVIKFYQNNLVHENTRTRQKSIECKGQTIGGLILSQPLGSVLQEARKQQSLMNRDRKLSTIVRPALNQQQLLCQGMSSPMTNIMLKLPTELQLLAVTDQKIKLRTKTKTSNNMISKENSMTRKAVHQRASIELNYEISMDRRVPRSDVNLFFQQINEFVRVTLKFKETITQAHLAQIRRLGRQIGLKFGNVKELDAKFINSKDFVAILKSKIFCMLNAVVMRASDTGTNPREPELQQAPKTYKFYVEPSGNNHMVVRSVIKRRSWQSSQELSQEHGWSGQGPKMLNLIWTQVRRPRILRELQPYQIYNHMDGINEISNKSMLFLNMQNFYAARGLDVFDYMPETYLIPSTNNFELNAQFKAFKQACQTAKPANQLWIFKPGESTNQGHGIRVFNDFEKIRQHMQEFCRHAENRRGQGRNRNCIIQRYIMRPLLIHKRKFDIRVFALISCHADTGLIRGYFYEEGYLRTSSKDFNIEKWDNRLIHLTNDAVQKHSADYGKYESANKISYHDFDKNLLKEKNVSFLQKIVPKIKEMVTDVLEATGRKLYRPTQLNENGSRSEEAINYNGFELLGFDFMLDNQLKLTLIEVNTNPCLDTPCMLLQRMIPTVLDQTFKIALDPFLQASEHQYYMTQDLTVSEMRFQLVYQDSMELARRDQQVRLQDISSASTIKDQQAHQLLPEKVVVTDSSISATHDNQRQLNLEDETIEVDEDKSIDDPPIAIQPNPNEPE